MRGGYLAVLTLLGLTVVGVPTPEAVHAAERKPSAAQKASAPGPLISSAQRQPGQDALQPIPAELLVPIEHFPAELSAPLAADWLTSPSLLAMSGEKFAAWRQAAVDPKVVAPPADLRGSLKDAVASSQGALARTPVPLPPRRPALVVASLQQDDVGRTVDDASAPDLEESPAAEAAPAARPIPASRRVSAGQAPAEIEVLILRHAERFALPASLVRRVAWRESKFDPKQRNGPYWGLMQIRVQTARGLGFRGEPADLLDADTNMTYAVAYLANAYKVAGRNETRAVALYAKGYYYEAKRKGMLSALIKTASVDQ
jgi:soluble lytic murein transglycosylase-like protein